MDKRKRKKERFYYTKYIVYNKKINKHGEEQMHEM